MCIAAAHNLSCAGLACEVYALDMRGPSGAGGGGGGHAVGNDVPGVGVEREITISRARKAVLDRLLEIRRQFVYDWVHHMGPHEVPIGSDTAQARPVAAA